MTDDSKEPSEVEKEQEATLKAMEELGDNLEIPPMPHTDAEMDARLQDISDRGRKARIRHDVEITKKTPRPGTDPYADKGLAYGMSAAYALIGLPIAFYGIGFLAERMGAQGDWKLGLAGVGVGFGFIFMLLILRRMNQ